MIIVLNNKSNLLKEEFIEYYKKLVSLETFNETVVLCPSFPHLALVTPSNIKLGAQNVSSTDTGAYTGEVNANQLKSYNVQYTIVGHSERRINQHERAAEISRKVKKLLSQNITPILCIGESLEEKNNPHVAELLLKELSESIMDIPEPDYERIIIAYEPIWSIGTGLIPTNQEIELRLDYIKKHFPNSKVLYGGSVGTNNIEELVKIRDLDGFLIGGISLEPDKLKTILNQIQKSS